MTGRTGFYTDERSFWHGGTAIAMLNHGTVQRQMGAFFERYDILLLPVLARPPAPIGVQPPDRAKPSTIALHPGPAVTGVAARIGTRASTASRTRFAGAVAA